MTKKILLLCVAFFSAAHVCTAGTAKQKTRRYVIPTPAEIAARKHTIAMHILGTFPTAFAAGIVNNPRFTFEPRVVARYEALSRRSPKPVRRTTHATHARYGYRYVTNTWSKEHGLAYLARYRSIFEGASRQFAKISAGIPAGIMDAETQYGAKLRKADYPIIPTLLTIAVYDPYFLKQKGWAEKQLLAFLRISWSLDWDAYARFGSRTGAWGKPQFEPTSYEALAMHWNGSACVFWAASPVPANLANDADAICSIYNYLHADGFGGSWAHQRKVLYRYNKSLAYCNAILRIARYFNTRLALDRRRRRHHHLATHQTTSPLLQRAALN